MAVYTELTFVEIAQLLKNYDALGALQSAVGIAEGVENSNYHLTTRAENDVQTSYILTIYEKRLCPEDLPFFIGIMQQAAANGIICPKPIANNQGALSAKLENGKTFAVFSFLPGRSIKKTNRDHAYQAGVALANMHRALDGFQSHRRNDLSLRYWQHTAKALSAGAYNLDNIHTGLTDLVRDEVAFLEERWAHFDDLPIGVIHADLFPNNVFFDEAGSLSGIIDFYFACNDLLAYDLAITINAWCFDTGSFECEKASAMIKGYQEIRALADEEIHALPVLLRGAAMRFLLTRAHDYFHNNQQTLGAVLDPKEYVDILQFHRNAGDLSDYGFQR